ncbi:hypothetical protein SAMN06295987_1011142 [Novosphingobium mathurense]|uniref:Uncharacterized protein n=2 Tax=Novosphingobium mathurense TaxID=428990 RepID=A0A1U6H2T4_9SPHN|nr:hypothetical protein SAMN06295987_1011142 [Novosphingobium mathurense]
MTGMRLGKARRLGLTGALILLGAASPLAAQDAFETAQILSGTAQQSGAGRSLGSAISRSMNATAQAIEGGQVRPARIETSSRRRHNSRSSAAVPSQVAPVPGGVDALTSTDAPAYRTDSGATIRTSGGLIATPTGTCVENCPEP